MFEVSLTGSKLDAPLLGILKFKSFLVKTFQRLNLLNLKAFALNAKSSFYDESFLVFKIRGTKIFTLPNLKHYKLL